MSKSPGAAQKPLPYAFARREEFLRLPPEGRTAYLWEAYTFCEKELSGKRFPQDELQRNLRVLRRMMLKVAKAVADKLRLDGTWRNASDERWPRHHKGDDVSHWYDSGCFPPQFMALPEDPTSWREVLAENPEALFDEMIAWVETPAGQAGVGDEDLQKLLADRETYLPPQEKPPPSASEDFDWESSSADREAGLQWLALRSSDGTLEAWGATLNLEKIQAFVGGIASNRRPIERLLPELMELEESGQWEALQSFLDVESHADAASLAKLRSCLPPGRCIRRHE